MKKRLASFLLATAFVLAAGAAFAWDAAVPTGGDFCFSNDIGARSGDLSASAAKLTFGPVVSFDSSNETSVDVYVFGPTAVISGDEVGSGVSFDKKKASTLFVRVPVAGAASGTWKIRGFGNTKISKDVSMDIKMAENPSPDKYSLAWPSSLVGITSKDIGYQDGSISWKVSNDVYGWMNKLEVSFDLKGVNKSSDCANSMDIRVCFVKTVPAVKLHYAYGTGTNEASGDIIVELSADKIVTTTLPVVRTTSTSGKSMKITSIENVGNKSFRMASATYTGLSTTSPASFESSNKDLYPGGKATGTLAVTSSDTGVPMFDMLGGYGLTAKWVGVVVESDMEASLEAEKSVADAKTANATLEEFKVKKQTLTFKIGGKSATFPAKVGSADFTAYSDVVASYDVSNALAATGFSLAPDTAVVSTDTGVVMPAFTFKVDHNKAIADGVFTATEWDAMLKKSTAAARRDAFLAKMSITFGVAGQKYDLVEFIDAAGFSRGDFITVSVNGNDVDVAVAGFYLVDGPVADITASKAADSAVSAGFKSLTIDGIPVVAFSDGTANDLFAMDALVNKASAAPITTYTVSGTVKGSDGAGIAGVEVKLGSLDAVSTDAAGAYTVSSVADGTYTATFTKDGYKAQSKSVTVAGSDVTVEDVVMVEGANLVVDLDNASGTDYSGSVTFTVTNASDDFVASADATVATNAVMALDAGDYKLGASDVSGYTVTVDTASFTVASVDVNAEATIATASSGGSSGGCNVGFAPLALLLLAPVMFLKK